jgi:uncharacterized protein YcfJ
MGSSAGRDRGRDLRGDIVMKPIGIGAAAGLVAALAIAGSALAQNPHANDRVCRQYADHMTAGLRQQAARQTVGGTLLGAGVGAALGAAIGGGKGAAIGAASGAIVGTGAGAAHAQNTEAYYRQQYYAYYNRCMASRSAPPPPYPPTYTPPGANTQNLNQQEINRLHGNPPPPGYYSPYR